MTARIMLVALGNELTIPAGIPAPARSSIEELVMEIVVVAVAIADEVVLMLVILTLVVEVEPVGDVMLYHRLKMRSYPHWYGLYLAHALP